MAKKKYPVRTPVPVGDSFEESCKHCKGSGQEPGLSDLTCRECIGRGRRKWRVDECKACQGQGKTGFLNWSKCSKCRGRGWLKRDVG